MMRSIKAEKLLCGLTHMYMFCSLLASMLVFVSVHAAMIFYSIGASSSYIAFGAATGDTIDLWTPFAIIVMGWAILFPVALLVSYILSIKKHYTPMCVMVMLDALVVVLWVLYAYTSGNDYGAGRFLADAVVSVLLAVAFLWVSRASIVAQQADEPAI